MTPTTVDATTVDATTEAFTTLDLVREGRTAWIRFTRPDQLNSLSEDVLSDLNAALDVVEADTGIRALVITGAGKAFFESVLTRLGALCTRLESLPVVTIAAVNGLARAGGFELMLSCDLVLIAEEAKIGDVHTVHGVAPGGGSTVRLPRVVGAQRAREIFLTGRWIAPAEAVTIGLALDAVPLAELDDAARGLAARLIDKSRDCLGAVKRQLVAVDGLPTAEGIAAERREFLAYVSPPDSDAQEGFQASVERREPSWR